MLGRWQAPSRRTPVLRRCSIWPEPTSFGCCETATPKRRRSLTGRASPSSTDLNRAVLIGVHLAVSETVVMVGPPWITWLSDEKVDLRRVLSVRGLPVPGSRPPNRATRTQLLHYFRGYLEGLAKLRQDELAGDWTKYDVAKDAASDAEWRRRRELEACHGSSRPECRFRPLQRRRRSRALDRRQGSWCRACVTAAE